MIARYSSAVATGSLVTLGLFLVMNALIALQPAAYTEPRQGGFLNIWRLHKEDTPLVTDQPIIDKSFIDPPVTPPRMIEQSGEHEIVGVTTAPPPPTGMPVFGTGPSLNDGPLVAMVRVQPVYPMRASELGLEGWVIVQFDVLEDGTVANVHVISSSSRVFEDASVKAAYRFRFKPLL